MKRQELIDTLRIYLEQQVYGKGLIPARNSVIKEGSDWSEFKFQFLDDKVQIIADKVLEFGYDEIMGVTYESENEQTTIVLYLMRKEPLTIKSYVKKKWQHFTSTNSSMRYRWGDYEVGKFLYCKGEKGSSSEPMVVFTRRPFDITTEGKVMVLKENEKWLGYLIDEENSECMYKEKGKLNIKRTLEFEGCEKKVALVREVIDYKFEDKSKTHYRSVSYFNVYLTDY